MTLRMNTHGEDNRVYKLTTAHPVDPNNSRQKAFLRKVFTSLVINLIATDICIAVVFLMNSPFFGIPGIYFAIRAIMGIWEYGGYVLGDGLKQHIIFTEQIISIRFFDKTVREYSYSQIITATLSEKGIMMKMSKDFGVIVEASSYEAASDSDEFLDFLREKLRGRIKVRFDENNKEELEEINRAAKRYVLSVMGSQRYETSYDLTKGDCRDFCRLILSKGRARGFITAITAILAAITTALTVFAVILPGSIFGTVAFIPLVLLLGVLFVSKIGIVPPAKALLAMNLSEVSVITVHDSGVRLVSGGNEMMYKWEQMKEACFSEELGAAMDIGNNKMIFIPIDLIPEDVYDFMEYRAVTAVENRKTEKK